MPRTLGQKAQGPVSLPPEPLRQRAVGPLESSSNSEPQGLLALQMREEVINRLELSDIADIYVPLRLGFGLLPLR